MTTDTIGFAAVDPDTGRALLITDAEGKSAFFRDETGAWKVHFERPSPDDIATNFAILSDDDAQALIAEALAALAPPIRYFNWEGRPAIFIGPKALAKLRADEDWTEVNAAEVIDSGRELTKLAFYDTFEKPRKSSYMCLALGRTLRHMGEKYGEPENIEYGRRLEAEAEAAIKAGFRDIEKFQKEQRSRRRARNLPRA